MRTSLGFSTTQSRLSSSLWVLGFSARLDFQLLVLCSVFESAIKYFILIDSRIEMEFRIRTTYLWLNPWPRTFYLRHLHIFGNITLALTYIAYSALIFIWVYPSIGLARRHGQDFEATINA